MKKPSKICKYTTNLIKNKDLDSGFCFHADI